jgi:hypothetical protein
MTVPTTSPSRIQKAVQTTIRRGKTLFSSDGYRIRPYPARPGVYRVARSEEDRRKLREHERPCYDVDIVHQDCTCPGFEHHGACKHLAAVNAVIAEAMRLLAPLLPAPSPK